MKKYFIKPFSSFWVSKEMSLKEKWLLTFRDPVWLILAGVAVVGWTYLIYILIK